MFDIRNYKSAKSEQNATDNEKIYWAPNFISKIDGNFPNINKECQELNERMSPESEDAFKRKLELWKEFTTVLQGLCKIYKVPAPKCLS